VREAARKDSRLKFTALLHHVDEDCLTEAFFNLKKTAAVGVDQVTWQEYEQDLEARIADLHGRLHRGAYRAKPSRRVWIPKSDGRQRPLGIASLEDKIVQQAVLWVLQAIYEQDFLGFSYGFRPGRSCHLALDALSVALTSKRVNWILDADIEGFFDNISHEWLMKFLEHRIGDRRMLRLILKWLRAGVSEAGRWSDTTVGTPQGAVIAPPTKVQNFLLASIASCLCKKGEVDAIHDADLVFFDRHAVDQCAQDFAPHQPVGRLKIAADRFRELVQAGQRFTQRRLFTRVGFQCG
jgi:group II intron reverse transcriptase/maturase